MKQFEFNIEPAGRSNSAYKPQFYLSQQNWQGFNSAKFGYAERVHYAPKDLIKDVIIGNDHVFLGCKHFPPKRSDVYDDKSSLRTFPHIHNRQSNLNDYGTTLSNRAYVPPPKKILTKLGTDARKGNSRVSSAKSLVRPATFQGVREKTKKLTEATLEAPRSIKVVTKDDWKNREKEEELNEEVRGVKELQRWERTYLRFAQQEARNAAENSRPATVGTPGQYSSRKDLSHRSLL